ncbi:MAG: dTDP-4-dehydrorhamnose 3,5-epimerase [Bacteroidota bacterium]
MIFEETTLPGAFLLRPERHRDERGHFARTYCRREFEAQGLVTSFVQASTSFNEFAGTMRGMHYQAAPYAETKLVRCTRGAVYDVIIDLRAGSETYGQHFGAVLSAVNGNALYIPEGFAHGFLTLKDRSEVFYQMSAYYAPEAALGVRWDDPAFNIHWPGAVRVIKDRDAQYPDFAPEAPLRRTRGMLIPPSHRLATDVTEEAHALSGDGSSHPTRLD